jgi:hypothetical protein
VKVAANSMLRDDGLGDTPSGIFVIWLIMTSISIGCANRNPIRRTRLGTGSRNCRNRQRSNAFSTICFPLTRQLLLAGLLHQLDRGSTDRFDASNVASSYEAYREQILLSTQADLLLISRFL